MNQTDSLDVQVKIKDLISEKNSLKNRVTVLEKEIEEMKTLFKTNVLQVGNFTFVGGGQQEGIYLLKEDGLLHKVDFK